jgi:hypothetical protein
MADATLAFPPSEGFAFAPDQGGDQDEAAQGEQRNQQIQQAFDAQRFQRTIAQGLGSALSKQAAQSAQQQRQIQQLAAQKQGKE